MTESIKFVSHFQLILEILSILSFGYILGIIGNSYKKWVNSFCEEVLLFSFYDSNFVNLFKLSMKNFVCILILIFFVFIFLNSTYISYHISLIFSDILNYAKKIKSLFSSSKLFYEQITIFIGFYLGNKYF